MPSEQTIIELGNMTNLSFEDSLGRVYSSNSVVATSISVEPEYMDHRTFCSGVPTVDMRVLTGRRIKVAFEILGEFTVTVPGDDNSQQVLGFEAMGIRVIKVKRRK
jgi:hypothetical protein